MSDQPHHNSDNDLKTLREQFGQLPGGEPSAELDQKILTMAEQALHRDRPTGVAGLLTEHTSLITAAAAAVFAVGVVLMLSDPTKEVAPSRIPTAPPLELELIEQERDTAEQTRIPAKPPALTIPPPPDLDDMTAQKGTYPSPASADHQADAALFDTTLVPEAELTPPQQPELTNPADESETLGQSVFLPLPQTDAITAPEPVPSEQRPVIVPDPGAERMRKQAPSSAARLQRYIPAPGAPAPSAANPNDSPLEAIIVSSARDESSAEAVTWDGLIAEARSARRAGDEATVTRIVEYLKTHYPDRELPGDLQPATDSSREP